VSASRSWRTWSYPAPRRGIRHRHHEGPQHFRRRGGAVADERISGKYRDSAWNCTVGARRPGSTRRGGTSVFLRMAIHSGSCLAISGVSLISSLKSGRTHTAWSWETGAATDGNHSCMSCAIRSLVVGSQGRRTCMGLEDALRQLRSMLYVLLEAHVLLHRLIKLCGGAN
jgi:hypothetical protein